MATKSKFRSVYVDVSTGEVVSQKTVDATPQHEWNPNWARMDAERAIRLAKAVTAITMPDGERAINAMASMQTALQIVRASVE